MSESAGGAGALDAQAATVDGTAPGPDPAAREAAEADAELEGMTGKLAQAERDHDAAKELLKAAKTRHAAAHKALGKQKEN
jgi:hypothetical protein